MIIVCGLPGSGKTTFANELAKKINIVCLHKDDIKESLYEIMRLKNLEDSKKVGLYSIKLLFELAEKIISKKIDLIVESPFSWDEDIEYFKKLNEKYKLNVYCVVCEIDEEERKKRFVVRPRHKAHHDNERLKMKEKDENWAYHKICDYNKMPGKILKIETNRPADRLVEDILCELDV